MPSTHLRSSQSKKIREGREARAQQARCSRVRTRSAQRGKKRRKKSDLTRFGAVKWVPVQWIEPPHSVRYPHHLERLVRSMRRARSKCRGGRMWTGRPLLVERVRPGYRHPGIRYVAWTGSHRIAAAFAAGQWLVPIIEIKKRCWDSAHGKPRHTRLSETYDDESRLATLMATTDERAIALMDREIPRGDREKKERAERRRQLEEQKSLPWRSLGPILEAAVIAKDTVLLRHKASKDTYTFERQVLEKVLAQFRSSPSPASWQPSASRAA